MAEKPTLILASKSASRRAMLECAQVPFMAEASDVDEALIKTGFRKDGKSVEQTATALAYAKAESVSAKYPKALVLGADQMLECGEVWLDKANTLAEAKEQLQFLSGKTHRLITAAVILKDGDEVWNSLIEAKMQMRVLSPEFIDDYCGLLGEELLGSVGCYALEGLGGQLFEHVEGDFFGILGLPLLPLLQALRAEGILKS
jgi:septum formation protein